MEYTLYIVLGTLFVGLALYHLWTTRKRRYRSELPPSPDTLPITDDCFDNFICFMRSDGSTFPGFVPRKEWSSWLRLVFGKLASLGCWWFVVSRYARNRYSAAIGKACDCWYLSGTTEGAIAAAGLDLSWWIGCYLLWSFSHKSIVLCAFLFCLTNRL